MNNRLPAVNQFFAAQPLELYFSGRWVGSKCGNTFETFDPGKGLAKVSAGDGADRQSQPAPQALI